MLGSSEKDEHNQSESDDPAIAAVADVDPPGPADLGQSASLFRWDTLAVTAGCAALATLHVYLWYPGIMDWDAASIAEMAATGDYSDWFPPTFIALWAVTDQVGSNPGTIFLLQTSLLIGGLLLFALGLCSLGRSAVAAAVIACAASPPFAYLFHEATKDTVMGAGLAGLAGLSAFLVARPPRRIGKVIAIIAAVLLSGLVLATRYNALSAILPILVLALFAVQGRRGLILSSAILVTGLLVGLSTFTTYVLRPSWSPIMSALVEFDVAGVLYRSPEATSIFVKTARAREQINRCYRPRAWDSLKYNHCAAELGQTVWDAYNEDPQAARAEWLRVISSYPLQYAQHRIRHVMSLLRITCDACDEIGTKLDEAATFNPSAPPARTLAIAFERLSESFFTAVRPWHCVLLAIGLMIVALFNLKSNGNSELMLITLAVSASGICYMAGYLIVGLSDPFRYSYWLYAATAIASISGLTAMGQALLRAWSRPTPEPPSRNAGYASS